jgi:hypothetical protein
VTPFEVVKIRLQQQKGLAYDKLKYHVSSRQGPICYDSRRATRFESWQVHTCMAAAGCCECVALG